MGIVFFDETSNVWDEHWGPPLEAHLVPSATEKKALSKLASMLRQAKWRTLLRINYNTWFRVWLNFALINECRILPAKSKDFIRFQCSLLATMPRAQFKLRRQRSMPYIDSTVTNPHSRTVTSDKTSWPASLSAG